MTVTVAVCCMSVCSCSVTSSVLFLLHGHGHGHGSFILATYGRCRNKYPVTVTVTVTVISQKISQRKMKGFRSGMLFVHLYTFPSVSLVCSLLIHMYGFKLCIEGIKIVQLEKYRIHERA